MTPLVPEKHIINFVGHNRKVQIGPQLAAFPRPKIGRFVILRYLNISCYLNNTKIIIYSL